MGDPVLEKLIEAATQDFRKRLEEAFLAGGEKVRRDLLMVLSPSGASADIAPRGLTYEELAAEGPESRAAPGTVKPTIIKMIEHASGLFGDGISAAEIIRLTGFKENSVRATISTLRSDGVIEQRGDRWFIKDESSSSSSATERSPDDKNDQGQTLRRRI